MYPIGLTDVLLGQIGYVLLLCDVTQLQKFSCACVCVYSVCVLCVCVLCVCVSQLVNQKWTSIIIVHNYIHDHQLAYVLINVCVCVPVCVSQLVNHKWTSIIIVHNYIHDHQHQSMCSY